MTPEGSLYTACSDHGGAWSEEATEERGDFPISSRPVRQVHCLWEGLERLLLTDSSSSLGIWKGNSINAAVGLHHVKCDFLFFFPEQNFLPSLGPKERVSQLQERRRDRWGLCHNIFPLFFSSAESYLRRFPQTPLSMGTCIHTTNSK